MKLSFQPGFDFILLKIDKITEKQWSLCMPGYFDRVHAIALSSLCQGVSARLLVLGLTWTEQKIFSKKITFF